MSLLGGMIILSRSGATHGRAIACGLIAIAATEISYLIYYLRESLSALQAASFFELASISFFIISVISHGEEHFKKESNSLSGHAVD